MNLLVNEAADIAHSAIFANHGQNCCAGSRTYVHEKIYDQFVARATELAAAKKLGNAFAEGTEQGRRHQPPVNLLHYGRYAVVL